MKKLKYIVLLGFLFVSLISFAQMDGPGNPGGDPVGSDPLGGGAPIGGGTLILIGLAAVYGGKKLYNLNKEELEE
jgi:hypothetical protein